VRPDNGWLAITPAPSTRYIPTGDPSTSKFEFLSRATGLWTLDPFLKTMTQNPQVPNAQGLWFPSGSDVAQATAFWSPRIQDRLVIITGGPNNGLWKENPTTHQWAKRICPVVAGSRDPDVHSGDDAERT
jgi:hypothetical protein